LLTQSSVHGCCDFWHCTLEAKSSSDGNQFCFYLSIPDHIVLNQSNQL